METELRYKKTEQQQEGKKNIHKIAKQACGQKDTSTTMVKKG